MSYDRDNPRVYHQKCPSKEQRTELPLKVEIHTNGSLILRGKVSEELEPKVMVAMRNSLEKKCFKDGVFEVLLPCLRKSSPSEKAQKVIAFCRWLSMRSGLRVTAQV